MTLVVRRPGLKQVDPLLPERRLAHADDTLEGVDGELGRKGGKEIGVELEGYYYFFFLASMYLSVCLVICLSVHSFIINLYISVVMFF